MRRGAVVLTALLATCAGALGAEPAPPCKGTPEVVGDCFKIHGRLTQSNGIPYRLWAIGTHRMLAPVDVPETVNDLFDIGWKRNKPMSISIFADFEVCPIEKERAGWMRAVCIESVANVVATDTEDRIVRMTRKP